jgi:hypothetical protein
MVMPLTELHSQLQQVLSTKPTPPSAGASPLRMLFDWCETLDREIWAMRQLSEPCDTRFTTLLNLLDKLTACARDIEATTHQDILLKMAIWRLQSTHLNRPVDTMKPLDGLAYTAFREMAELCDDRSVLNTYDLVGR